MRILAIDCSTRCGSIALCEDQRLLSEITLPDNRRTSQTLSPVMANLFDQLHWAPHTIDVVGVTVGPGSFTGLRIGVTAAKTFAYAVEAELVAANTLEVLARQVNDHRGQVVSVIDAQRGQWFVGRFDVGPSEVGPSGVGRLQFRQESDCRIVDAETCLSELRGPSLITGPALYGLPEERRSQLATPPAEQWSPRAGTVGAMAYEAAQRGDVVDVWSILPKYYRPSYAEESSQSKPE